MGRKEELVYGVLGLPFPNVYFDRLDEDKTGHVGRSVYHLLKATGYEFEEGRLSPTEEALYQGSGLYVGDIEPKDLEKAVIQVMDEYIDLVQEAVDIPGLSDIDREKIYARGMPSYRNYIEAFSDDKTLISKHWKNADNPDRIRYISTFEPTISGYLAGIEKKGLKISAFFLRRLKILLPEEDRKRHTYICAKTGSGKSELLKMLVYSYLKKPDYCTTVVIEPHGDLCEEIAKFKENCRQVKEYSAQTNAGALLNALRKSLENSNNFSASFYSPNLVYIDPTLYDDFTPSINPFELKDKSEKNIDVVSQELAGVFDELLKSTNLSLQMETILIPCISVLLRLKNATVKDLQIFMDDERNGSLVNHGKLSPNEAHREFFQNAFFNKSYGSTKQSIYTKIQSLLNSPGFANFIAKPSTLDLEAELNGKKLILFNLSKGKMGDDSSEAAGRFIVAMIQSIIKRRAWEHKSQRVPVHMYIDECQNYVSPSIETSLTELRKYGLHMTLANQFIGQNMDIQFKNALLSSTNIKFIGMNNASSLSILAKETGADFEELQKLKTGEFYLKCGHLSPFKVYIPSFLMGNSNSVTPEQWQSLLIKQKANYYQEKKPRGASDLGEEIGAKNQARHHSGAEEIKPKFNL